MALVANNKQLLSDSLAAFKSVPLESIRDQVRSMGRKLKAGGLNLDAFVLNFLESANDKQFSVRAVVLIQPIDYEIPEGFATGNGSVKLEVVQPKNEKILEFRGSYPDVEFVRAPSEYIIGPGIHTISIEDKDKAKHIKPGAYVTLLGVGVKAGIPKPDDLDKKTFENNRALQPTFLGCQSLTVSNDKSFEEFCQYVIRSAPSSTFDPVVLFNSEGRPIEVMPMMGANNNNAPKRLIVEMPFTSETEKAQLEKGVIAMPCTDFKKDPEKIFTYAKKSGEKLPKLSGDVVIFQNGDRVLVSYTLWESDLRISVPFSADANLDRWKLFAPIIVPRTTMLLFGHVDIENTKKLTGNQTAPDASSKLAFALSFKVTTSYWDMIGFLRNGYSIPVSARIAAKLVGCSEGSSMRIANAIIPALACLSDSISTAPAYLGDDRYEFRAVSSVELLEDSSSKKKKTADPVTLLRKATALQGDNIIGPRVFPNEFVEDPTLEEDPLVSASWPYNKETKWLVFAVLKTAPEVREHPPSSDDDKKLQVKYLGGGGVPASAPAPAVPTLAASSIVEIAISEEEIAKKREEMAAAATVASAAKKAASTEPPAKKSKKH